MASVIIKESTDYEVNNALVHWLKGNSPTDGRELDSVMRQRSLLPGSIPDGFAKNFLDEHKVRSTYRSSFGEQQESYQKFISNMLVWLGEMSSAPKKNLPRAHVQKATSELIEKVNWEDGRLTSTYASFLSSMPDEFLKCFAISINNSNASDQMNLLLVKVVQQVNSEKRLAVVDNLGFDPRVRFLESQVEDAHAGCCATPDPEKDFKAFGKDFGINASQTVADGGLAWWTGLKIAISNAIHEGLDTLGSFSSWLPSLAPKLTKRWPRVHAKMKKIFANPRTDASIGFTQGLLLAGGLWASFLFAGVMPSIAIMSFVGTLGVTAYTFGTNIWRKRVLEKATVSHNQKGSILHAWFDIGGALATPIPYVAAFFTSVSTAGIVEQGLSGALAAAGSYFGYKLMRPALATLRGSRPSTIKKSDSKRAAALIKQRLARLHSNEFATSKVSKVRFAVESINEVKISMRLPASFFDLSTQQKDNACLEVLTTLAQRFDLRKNLSLAITAKSDRVTQTYEYSPPHEHDHSHDHDSDCKHGPEPVDQVVHNHGPDGAGSHGSEPAHQSRDGSGHACSSLHKKREALTPVIFMETPKTLPTANKTVSAIAGLFAKPLTSQEKLRNSLTDQQKRLYLETCSHNGDIDLGAAIAAHKLKESRTPYQKSLVAEIKQSQQSLPV